MPASAGDHQDAPDIEFAATVEAADLRFREVPSTEIRFSGTPDYESSVVSRRRNLPDRVSEDVDYHDVRVDYLLTNRLRNGNPSQKRQRTAGPDHLEP
jgi:hypothetical protein